jgi:cell division protein FtsZ
MTQAERGLNELSESVDTVIVIPNEKLLAVAQDAGFFESFRVADDILRQGVQGISDIITIPGIINRDFADVKAIMAGMGYAVMGTATGRGDRRTMEAATRAIASPLLEAGAIDGARGILINITGSSTLKLAEVNEASSIIQNAAHEDANIIFGAVLDEKMKDEVKITVIATGFRTDFVGRISDGSRVSAAAAIQHARTAHHYDKPAPTINQRKDEPYEVRAVETITHVTTPEPVSIVQHAPVAVEPQPVHVEEPRKVTPAPTPVAAEYEQDDLDVPAFLRKKRTE